MLKILSGVPITLFRTVERGSEEQWHVDESLHWLSGSPRASGQNSRNSTDVQRLRRAWLGAPVSFSSALMVSRLQTSPDGWDWRTTRLGNGSNATSTNGPEDSATSQDRDALRSFPPEVAFHLVKLACERPDNAGASLSQWDCSELVRQLINSGIVDDISTSTVWRILNHHKLKPWRYHMWLSPKHPRDAEFYSRIRALTRLYTRLLESDEVVLCVDEKTSLQPRPRLAPTKPAQPELPNRVEHEYRRDGALNLFSAFDTRTGIVYGQCYSRKRQAEFIRFLEYLESKIPATIAKIHLVCDNVPTHHGKQVRQWLASHPRFVFHFTPVHCSWMNQVEQWFSILQRKRFRIADFESKTDLEAKVLRFIAEWNTHATPFDWTKKSATKVMAAARKVAA